MSRASAAHPSSAAIGGVAAAAIALAGSLAQLAHGADLGASERGSGDLDWASAALTVAATVPLAAWPRAPRAVFALTATATVLLTGFGYPLGLPLGPIIALYLLAASRDEGDPWTRRDTTLVATLFAAYLAAAALAEGGFPGAELLHTGLAWGLAWFAGERTRLRHQHIADLHERARRAERDAERDRQLAVAEERARIARDLHDAAGHAINVIAVRAGAARMHNDPERSQATLEAIEELARDTVAEIDQIVGTLRDRRSGDSTAAEPPGLASLDTLAARQAAAGLDVTITRTGQPHPLDGAVDQAAYRILQETLTNAARHGTGTAQVTLDFRTAAFQLTITNPVRSEHANTSNGGHGLIGMRERATLVGGRLDIDGSNGSFRVRAQLPYQPSRP